MGFSGKLQQESGLESDGKKWVIAGISVRSPLSQISTKTTRERDGDEEEESCFRTPTMKGARLPEKFPCPAAPRKLPTPRKSCRNGAREFFPAPDDLESVFFRKLS